MPGPYEVIFARVKQKYATEEEWLIASPELGPVFEGEQCFVRNEDGLPVNFKIGDGTKTFEELPYFITYLSGVANLKVLPYLNQTGNVVIAGKFRNQSFIQHVIILNNSGDEATIKMGTTLGGNEIFELDVPVGPVTIGIDYLFTSTETAYITNSEAISVFVIYVQMDESPVAPTGGGGGGGFTSTYNLGTVYEFIPMYDGHLEYAWDFLTGLGKTGTPYEGCQILTDDIVPGIENSYLITAGIGDDIGELIGNTDSQIQLGPNNIPRLRVDLPANSGGVPGSGGITFGGKNNNTVVLEVKSNAGASLPTTPDKIGIQPRSLTVLRFTGPNSTT